MVNEKKERWVNLTRRVLGESYDTADVFVRGRGTVFVRGHPKRFSRDLCLVSGEIRALAKRAYLKVE